MKRSPDSKVWVVEVLFEESPDRTDATALLRADGVEYGGWGRARRTATDPAVPAIGEQLAAARALSDLAHTLLDAAATAIAEREGHPVHLHP